MILVLDNYDSFTYNLVQYFGELGAELIVRRNDRTTILEIEQLHPEKICISPGPGTPDEAGISNEVIRHFGPRIPVLGVCLGHQCIGQVYGGEVIRADRLMHGKTSPILHEGDGVFRGLPIPFEAARLGCAVLHGPDMSNCAAMAAALAAADAAETVSGAAALAQSVSALLADQRLRAERTAAAARVAAAGLGILDAVLERLGPWLDRLAPLRDPAPSPRWVRA